MWSHDVPREFRFDQLSELSWLLPQQYALYLHHSSLLISTNTTSINCFLFGVSWTMWFWLRKGRLTTSCNEARMIWFCQLNDLKLHSAYAVYFCTDTSILPQICHLYKFRKPTSTNFSLPREIYVKNNRYVLSLSRESAYHQMSQRLGGANLICNVFQSLWNLAVCSAAELPDLSNFKAIWAFKQPNLRVRGFARSDEKIFLGYSMIHWSC